MEMTKMKLLRVLDILQDTDEDHPMTTNQIIEQLELFGIKTERKSVQRDIAILQEYGHDIVLCDDNKLGYFMASRQFEDWELKILMDAVLSARFLSSSDTKRLAEKIQSLASKDMRKTLKVTVPIEGDIKKGVPMTKNYIDIVLKAIRQKKKIIFKYVTVDEDLNEVFARGGSLYEFNPYSLIWRRDKYYIVGLLEGHEKIAHYRLDKVRSLSMLDQPAIPPESVLGPNPDLALKQFVNDTIHTYSGEKIHLILDVKKGNEDVLFDYFVPDEVTLIRKMKGYITVAIDTTLSDGLYFWLLQYGGCVRAVEPEIIKKTMNEKLDKMVENYNREKK